MSNVGVSVSLVVAPTKQVRKRDGTTLQPFDPDKIKKAVRAAWEEAKAPLDERSLGKVVRSVTDALSDDVVDVETIQDAVETSLMRHKQFPVAKAFILYRQQRAEARQERIGKSPDPLAISDYIHASKYARYLPELQRREVYEETVARTEQMHIRRFPELEEDIRWAFDRVREKRVLPSLRSMQFGGAAIEAVHNRLYNCSYSYIDRPEAFSQALYLLLCGCGVGYSVQFEHVERLPSVPYIDPKKIRHHVIADTIEGWADALKALIQGFLDGVYVEFAYHLIRGAGVPLKTSGGRAPGHVGLKTSLERIRSVLSGAQGRKLRSVECHRILCHAADAVLSGGIRRAAMLALFSLEDSEMMQIKTGNWYASEPWLANANNSVAIKRDEVKKKAFKRIFQMTKEWGEPGFLFVDDYGYGTNPCIHPDAFLHTSSGYRRVGDLFKEGSPVSVVCDARVGKFDALDMSARGIEVRQATNVFLTQTQAPVYRVTTDHGHQLTVTDYHEFPTTRGRLRLKDMKVGDRILLPSGVGSFGSGGTREDGFLLGSFVGDGTTTPDGLAFVDVWEADFEDLEYIKGAIRRVVATIPTWREYPELDWTDQTPTPNSAKKRIGGRRFGKWVMGLSDDGSLYSLKERVPRSVWGGSREFVEGYIRGLFHADGSVMMSGHKKSTTLSTRLSSVKPQLLRDVQMLLGMFGIASRIYSRKPAGKKMMPDGRGSLKCYDCQETFEIIVNRPNSIALRNRIGLQGRKARILDAYLKERGENCPQPERYIAKIAAIEEAGQSDVYCITEPVANSIIINGIVTGQCGEIGLFPHLTVTADLAADLARRGIQANVGDTHTGYAFCNLSEINGAKLESKGDFLIAAKAATILGTLQASYTDMPYLGWASEEIAKRDALLGVGMTGMFDSPEIACNPEMQREVVANMVAWNREYAAKVGIRSAARISCVKPSGTSSLELGGVASGHHPHHARRYIRRVTADELEHVFQAFRAVNPHMCVRKPDGKWVIEFPVEAPPNAIVKEDVRALPFLEMVKSTQQNWVLPGTVRPEDSPGLTHNVSNTVVVREEEWDDVAEYLWSNRTFFTGVSMLPATGDKAYAFAPFEAITTPADESRWNAILASYQPVDYSAMVETDDTTDLKGEVACAGGACAIV